MCREPEFPEARVPVVECLDGLARITSMELAPIHSVKNGIPPECLFYKSESGCRFGEKWSYAASPGLTNRLAKGPKRMVAKVQWLC